MSHDHSPKEAPRKGSCSIYQPLVQLFENTGPFLVTPAEQELPLLQVMAEAGFDKFQISSKAEIDVLHKQAILAGEAPRRHKWRPSLIDPGAIHISQGNIADDELRQKLQSYHATGDHSKEFFRFSGPALSMIGSLLSSQSWPSK